MRNIPGTLLEEEEDLSVVQIPKIYIAVQCIFNIFKTAFRQIMNLLTRPMYYRVCIF